MLVRAQSCQCLSGELFVTEYSQVGSSSHCFQLSVTSPSTSQFDPTLLLVNEKFTGREDAIFSPIEAGTVVLTATETTGASFSPFGGRWFRIWSGAFSGASFLGQLAERGPISPQCQLASFLSASMTGNPCPSKYTQLGNGKEGFVVKHVKLPFLLQTVVRRRHTATCMQLYFHRKDSLEPRILQLWSFLALDTLF